MRVAASIVVLQLALLSVGSLPPPAIAQPTDVDGFFSDQQSPAPTGEEPHDDPQPDYSDFGRPKVAPPPVTTTTVPRTNRDSFDLSGSGNKESPIKPPSPQRPVSPDSALGDAGPGKSQVVIDHVQGIMDQLKAIEKESADTPPARMPVHHQPSVVTPPLGKPPAEPLSPAPSAPPPADSFEVLPQPQSKTRSDNVALGASLLVTEVPVLHLIVNADPGPVFSQTIAKLERFGATDRIRIGSVLIVGGEKVLPFVHPETGALLSRMSDIGKRGSEGALAGVLSSLRNVTPQPARSLNALGLLPSPETPDVAGLAARFGITVSPTWIVTAEGRNHVFQGSWDPSDFLDAEGGFHPPQT